MAIIFKLTDEGRQALINARADGLQARTVSSVGITANAFTPISSMDVLPNEIKRITALSGASVAPNTIHITVRDDGSDVYTVRGLGIYLDNGVLLGTYSQPDVILEKASASIFLLSTDLRVLDGSVDISTLLFGDTSFINPPATTEVMGVVELATTAEVQAGTDTTRAVTPATLAARTATEARTGLVELATAAEVQAGTDTARAVTPAALAARTATEARTGLVELATTAEATTGSDTARAVTPAGLKAAIDAAAVGDASTTVAGKVVLASNAEAQAGTNTTKALTPAALAARTATEARTGLVELATTAEATTGSDTARAVTPAGLKAAIGAAALADATTSAAGKIMLATSAEAQTGTNTTKAVTPAALAARTATEARTGLVELATAAEATTGTDTARAVTPAGVLAAINANKQVIASGSAPVYGARAWVNFNGLGTVAIRSSGNVSSITDNGVGDYTINFTTALSNANYSVVGMASNFYGGEPGGISVRYTNRTETGVPVLRTASAVRVCCGVANSSGGYLDYPEINIAIFC